MPCQAVGRCEQPTRGHVQLVNQCVATIFSSRRRWIINPRHKYAINIIYFMWFTQWNCHKLPNIVRVHLHQEMSHRNCAGEMYLINEIWPTNLWNIQLKSLPVVLKIHFDIPTNIYACKFYFDNNSITMSFISGTKRNIINKIFKQSARTTDNDKNSSRRLRAKTWQNDPTRPTNNKNFHWREP